MAAGNASTLTEEEVSDPSATRSWAGPPVSSAAPRTVEAPRETEPEPIPQRTTAPVSPRRNPLPVVATLLALAVVAALIFVMLNADDDPPARNEAEPKQSAAAQDPSPTPEETEPENEPAAQPRVPAGWTEYTDPETGYRIAHPEGWTISDDSVDSSSTDFEDPASSTYLRVDWTDTPGTDAAAAWEAQAASFSQTHDDYQEITIEDTSFKGADTAAIWEFTYSEGGATLHAIDLGFAWEDYGFALNFQTLEEDWAGSQEIFSQLKRSFRPPR